jgi:hypothetical protein
MKTLILFFLLSSSLYAQLSPPTQVVKKRNGQAVTVAWNFTDNAASAGLLYFSVKATPNLNQTPTQLVQVPPTARQTDLTVVFTTQNPNNVYYVVSAIYSNPKGESFPSNTIAVQRIGPPPQ